LQSYRQQISNKISKFEFSELIAAISCHSRAGGNPKKMTDKQYYVYIICNKPNGTLYTGITSDLIKRIWQHKKGLVEGFSKKYGVKTLVYFEVLKDVEEAILREKRIKKWNRKWKINLIEKANPDWNDLYQNLV
jgi:putative endonuclease